MQSALNPTYQLITPSTMNPNNNFLSSRTSSSTTNLSSTANVVSNDEQQTPTVDTTDDKTCTTLTPLFKLKEFFYDIYSLIKHLLLNLRFMGITCCAIVEALLIKGYLAFLSKHIEYQFRTTSSHSSVYIGVISLFSVNRFLIVYIYIIFSYRLFLALH
jgi:hypothetical protein